MLKEKKLITFVSTLIDLLDRKKTYENVISEKRKKISILGIENKENMPIYPKLNYDFSLRRLILKSFLFSIVYWLTLGLLSELIKLFNESFAGNVVVFLILTLPLGGISIAVITELCKKNTAKKAADLSYNHAVNRVREQHRQDDIRVAKELEQASKINTEVLQWQKKLENINSVIERSCEFGDISFEYCSINVLIVFLEYLRDGRCSTIYECMLKYDETSRRQQILDDVNAIENEIEKFEDAFAEAIRQSEIYLRYRNEEVRKLCRHQEEMIEEIEYNQDTTRKCTFMLSLLD